MCLDSRLSASRLLFIRTGFTADSGISWACGRPLNTRLITNTPFGGQEPYNSVLTHSSDALENEFIYVSKPVSEYSVP